MNIKQTLLKRVDERLMFPAYCLAMILAGSFLMGFFIPKLVTKVPELVTVTKTNVVSDPAVQKQLDALTQEVKSLK